MAGFKEYEIAIDTDVSELVHESFPQLLLQLAEMLGVALHLTMRQSAGLPKAHDQLPVLRLAHRHCQRS